MIAGIEQMLQFVNERDYDGGLGVAQAPDGAQLLDEAAAMRLLASVDYGRVVFTLAALPAIRVVNHLVDGDRIIIRTRADRGDLGRRAIR